jgi:hypothetical protein
MSAPLRKLLRVGTSAAQGDALEWDYGGPRSAGGQPVSRYAMLT